MWRIFDFVTFSYLILVAAFLLELVHVHKTSQKKRVVTLLFVLFSISWLVVFYGSFVEPRFISNHNYAVQLNEPSGAGHMLKAVVIADLHVGPYKGDGWIEKIVAKTNALEPDFVFLVGDYVFNDSSQISECQPFEDLEAKYGVYAITGNHDYMDDNIKFIVNTMEGWGIRFLENENVTLRTNEGTFTLVGINDLWFDADMDEAFSDVGSSVPVILLAHNPDVILDSLSEKADLIISGHTHGGQIRLPLVGSVAPIPDQLGRAYDRGAYQLDEGNVLIISQGLGETGARARLFNPPELTVIEIGL